MDLGVHCSYSYCKQIDYLPFNCQLCSRYFCLEHKSQSSHECQFLNVQKKAIICHICNKTIKFKCDLSEEAMLKLHKANNECTEKAVTQVIRTCQFNKCYVKLNDINSNFCKSCKKDFCLRHRLPEVHNCCEKNINPQQDGDKKTRKGKAEEPTNLKCCSIQ